MKLQKRKNWGALLLLSIVAILAMLVGACAPAQTGSAPAADSGAAAEAGDGQLEIFSWWTSGGEVEALQAIYDIFSEQYPNVTIDNAALASGQGQGGNMKALLETRMMGGEPPDSFQVHLGRELIDSHVIADRMEPLAGCRRGKKGC